MGPQLDSCGRLKRFVVGVDRRGASMGPQLDSCGRPRARHKKGVGHVASMGPQLDSCGRRPMRTPIPDRPPLQWGRNLTVAEGGGGRMGVDGGISFNGAAT